MSAAPRSQLRFWGVRLIIGGALTAGLFAFLLRYIDLAQIGQLFYKTRWGLWGTGLALWVIIYLVRALRFVQLAPRTPYLTMLGITAVHNFLLRLLPLRSGELAYAYLIRRSGTAGLGESLISLLLLRILDSTMVVILFAAALALHQGAYLGDRRLGLLAAGAVALLGLLAVAALVPLLRLGLHLAQRVSGWLGLTARPRVQQLLSKAAGAVDSFDHARRSAIWAITALSAVQWLLTFAAFFAIMQAFSMPVSIAQTTLGSTAAVVTGFLPIGGIGSFGTLEAGWALGFALVGLEQEQAIASGFGVSITTFAYGALLGLFGWIGLWLIGKNQAQRELGR